MAPGRSKRSGKKKDNVTHEADTTTSTTKSRFNDNEDDLHGDSKTAIGDRIVEYTLPFQKDKSIICHRYTRPDGDNAVSMIFTHGAGGDISNPTMTGFAQGYAALAPLVLFQGMMNLQNRVARFEAVLNDCDRVHVLGGRSMGARAAVLTAKDHPDKVDALVLASFPLTSGSDGDSREDILVDISDTMDVLFISGDGDSMCHLDNLERVRRKMKAKSWLAVVEGADHGMGLKDKRGVAAVRAKCGEIAALWSGSRDRTKTEMRMMWDARAAEVVVSDWRDTGVARSRKRPEQDAGAEPGQAPVKKRQKQKRP